MKDKNKLKTLARQRKKKRIHKKLRGTSTRPRLAVYRSLNNIYAQLIDDATQSTIAGLSSLTNEIRYQLKGVKDKREQARLVGKLLAQKAKDRKITQVVFDRSGYLYHGRVKALAEGAREGGLEF